MPIVRPLLRATLTLVIVCALMIGGGTAIGKVLPSRGIIYASRVSGSRYIYLLDPLRRARYDLYNQQIISSAAIAPDGKLLAFAQNDALSGVSKIRLFDFNAVKISTIYTAPYNTNNTVYAWSPSGRYLSFRSDGKLLKYDFLTDGVSALIDETRADYFNDSYATWSPDETQVVFVSTLRETNTWQGYLANTDGSNLRQVTRVDVCMFYAPIWSPTSNQVVFSANCENTPTLFLLDTGTKILRTLADLNMPTWGARWSPDGSRLLFRAGIRKRSIYTIAADGSDLRLLVDDGDFASWSPDGQSVVFSLSVNMTYGNLYTIHADGSNLQQLTFEDGESYFIAVDWSR